MGCVSTVQGALEGLAGVKRADVSLSDDQADVVYDTSSVSIKLMREAVVNAGYGISDHTAPKPYADATEDKSHKEAGENTDSED